MSEDWLFTGIWVFAGIVVTVLAIMLLRRGEQIEERPDYWRDM